MLQAAKSSMKAAHGNGRAITGFGVPKRVDVQFKRIIGTCTGQPLLQALSGRLRRPLQTGQRP